MPDIIIPDTSSLIVFDKIGEIELLKHLYSKIIITPEVAEEFVEILPDWIVLQPVEDVKYQEFLETQVDSGEASVIALGKEVKDALLLLDDLKARKLAHRLNMRYTGALGVIHKAKQSGYLKRIKPLIDKLLEADFQVSDKIIKELLRLNDEAD